MKQKETISLNETQLRVLGLFTQGFDREYYVREIGKLLLIGPRTAQLNLEQLERLGILESQSRGKIKIYFLRKNELATEYLKLAEMFKTIRFLEKKSVVREILFKITPYIEGIGAVFGSYAKGMEKEDSDLDVFIVGKCNRNKITEVSDTYGIEVSIKNYPLDIFKKDVAKDILIKEIIKNHIVFQGVELFVKTVREHG